MLLDLSDVLSTEGQVNEYELASDLKEFSFRGRSYTIKSVDAFRVTARNEGKRKASLTGGCSVTIKTQCDRCLDEITKVYDVTIDEMLDLAVLETGQPDVINELDYLKDCTVDMDMLLQKELMSMVPMQILCKDDCKGLCKVCGANRNREACGCNDFVPDPRLSVFANILKN